MSRTSSTETAGSPTTWQLIRRYGPVSILGTLAGIFILQNTASTSFSFLTLNFTAPLFIILIAFGFVGAGLQWSMSWRRSRRNRRDR
jgi:uncharacterized integral membrane protein